MVAQSLVVNESENGMWLVFWELKELPQVKTNVITANSTFHCAGFDYKLTFGFGCGAPYHGMVLIFQTVSAG
jgi:hypothetical protein